MTGSDFERSWIEESKVYSLSMIVVLYVGVLFFIPTTVWAQDSTKKPKLEKNKTLRIQYKYPVANRSSRSVDVLKVFLKDGISGKIAQMELQETEPDSGVFAGAYMVDWTTPDLVVAEVYLPPEHLLDSKLDSKIVATEMNQLIGNQKIARMPYFIKKNQKGIQEITVHNTKEEAIRAYEDFLQTALSVVPAPPPPIPKPMPSIIPAAKQAPQVDPEALEAARKAALKAEEEKLANEARQRELERQRLKKLEEEKQAELKRKQSEMAAEEIKRRKAQAIVLGQNAMRAYMGGDFVKAEAFFKESIELDANNPDLYYQYGVTLYKNEKFNLALVVLRGAQLSGPVSLERDYYVGLTHMRLKEYRTALEVFEKVKVSNDKVLGPSAAFYQGVIEFTREKWDIAQKYFEFVLDHSDDPRLDQQAEAYVDQIAAIKEFEANKAKKFIFTLGLGLTQDSNLLGTNLDLSGTSASDAAGWRFLYLGGLEFRPLYNEVHELSIAFNYTEMRSYSSAFKTKDDFSKADPRVTTWTIPYKNKGKLLNKVWQLALVLGSDDLRLDANGDGTKEQIGTSTYIKADQTFVMDENWITVAQFEARQDKSMLAAATDNDVSDATKLTFGNTNTWFQNKKKTQAWIQDATLALNNAKGKNARYTRLDVGGSYMTPAPFGESTWITKLSYGYGTYSEKEPVKTDTPLALTFTWAKPLPANLGAALVANYTMGNTTDEASKANKYTIMTLLTWNGSL